MPNTSIISPSFRTVADQAGRSWLLNVLHRRERTIRHTTDKVSFLELLARPVQFSSGTPVEVDGDALAMLRAVSS